ncbi:MAG: trypsin-like serine protease [Verrucomicrobiota bacterium]|jgi:hypothetical protein
MNRLIPKTAPQDTEKLTTITPPESPLADLQAPFRRLKSVAAAAALFSMGGLDTDQAQAGRIDPSVPIETYRQMGEQARGPISWSLKNGTWVQRGGAGYLTGTYKLNGYDTVGTASGFFLNPRTFVTVASMTETNYHGDVKVGWSSDAYNPNLPEITVSKIIVHPDYRPDQRGKGPDIAVVHLSKPVQQVDAAGVEGAISGSCYLASKLPKGGAIVALQGYGKPMDYNGKYYPGGQALGGQTIYWPAIAPIPGYSTNLYIGSSSFGKITETFNAPFAAYFGDTGGPASVVEDTVDGYGRAVKRTAMLGLMDGGNPNVPLATCILQLTSAPTRDFILANMIVETPPLTITSDQVSWPENGWNFVLERSTDMANWTPTEPHQTIGKLNWVRISPDAGPRQVFYRLRHTP